MLKISLISSLLISAVAFATPDHAERIWRSYELSAETWALKYQLAATVAEKQALMANRPDPEAAAKQLWSVVAPSLDQAWTIQYAANFMDLTRSLPPVGQAGKMKPAYDTERKRAISVFRENHLKQPDIAQFCIALAESADPMALPTLEKIIAENPDESMQGIAALSASMLLRGLGDAPEVMKKRLTYLRKAIIHASEQQVGDSKVADIVAEELYVIRYLSKGRIAPDLEGTDVAGQLIQISDLRGNPLVLLFWDAKSPETDKIITLTNQLAVKYDGKPLAILGITPEPLDRIRSLQADGSIKWNNIIDAENELAQEYRIVSRPAVLVLNAQGVIEYAGLPGSFVELTVDALLADAAPKQ